MEGNILVAEYDKYLCEDDKWCCPQ